MLKTDGKKSLQNITTQAAPTLAKHAETDGKNSLKNILNPQVRFRWSALYGSIRAFITGVSYLGKFSVLQTSESS